MRLSPRRAITEISHRYSGDAQSAPARRAVLASDGRRGHRTTADDEPREAGFGLVEIIITMFVLALMAIALIPLMITAIQASASNRSQVAATTYANSEIAGLRQSFGNDSGTGTCTAVKARAHGNRTDPSGSGLVSTLWGTTAGQPPACPSDYPGTMTVVVTVSTNSTPATKLTTLTTKVLVSAP